MRESLSSCAHWAASRADDLVSWLRTLLYVNVLQPLLLCAGFMDVDEDTFDALY